MMNVKNVIIISFMFIIIYSLKIKNNKNTFKMSTFIHGFYKCKCLLEMFLRMGLKFRRPTSPCIAT